MSMTLDIDTLPDLDEFEGMRLADIALSIGYSAEGSEDQQRAIAALVRRASPGIGHNRPPLAEALSEELAADRARAEQLIAAAEKSLIVDEDSAEKVVDLARQITELDGELDRARLVRTKPYRDAQKLVNDIYGGLQMRLVLAYKGTDGESALRGLLTRWERKKRDDAEAERRRLAEEARQREAEAEAARRKVEEQAQTGKVSVDAEVAVLQAEGRADLAQQRVTTARPLPTRSQLGQTARPKVIRHEITDAAVVVRWAMRAGLKNAVVEFASNLVARHLRSLGVAAVARGVEIPGAKSWVEDGAVNVRR